MVSLLEPAKVRDTRRRFSALSGRPGNEIRVLGSLVASPLRIKFYFASPLAKFKKIGLIRNNFISSKKIITRKPRKTGLRTHEVEEYLKCSIFQSAAEFGNFTFTMDMYETDAYLKPYDSFPVRKNLNDKLYLEVKVMSNDSKLVLIPEKCWATPDQDPDNSKSFAFIDKG